LPLLSLLLRLLFRDRCRCRYKSSDYIKFHNISEDCLYLNIFVPSGAGPSSALPVMHFLYGGSWEWGGSSFAIYDSAPVVAERGNVIFVTSNYRLGMFGYLGGAALAAESSDGSTGNYGLQDQRMAMEWIRDNIASFGGDPGNVMLFGQSAGSGSVANHLIMPRSSGLFQRAGMESGPPCDWTAIPLDVSEAKFHVLCGDAGCCPGGKVPDAASIACLRGKSMAAIANLSHHSGGGLLDWSPVIDGVEITEEPQQLVQQGTLRANATSSSTHCCVYIQVAAFSLFVLLTVYRAVCKFKLTLADADTNANMHTRTRHAHAHILAVTCRKSEPHQIRIARHCSRRGYAVSACKVSSFGGCVYAVHLGQLWN